MSLSKSSQIFRFSWQPSKQVAVFVLLTFCIAQGCLLLSALPTPIKCLLAIIASLYTARSIRQYYCQPKTQFFSNSQGLYCERQLGITEDLANRQWQDWGFIFVLNAQLNGKNSHWFWLSHQLSELEKRELRLMMRANQKKVAHQLPCITTNPVL